METSPDPALNLPREAPPASKVRIRPRPVIKPQVEKDRDAAVRPDPAAAARLLRFECPSCFGMLSVALDTGFDGNAAPCPLCGTDIVAPRLAERSTDAAFSRQAQAPPKGEPIRPDRRRADFRFVEGRFRRAGED